MPNLKCLIAGLCLVAAAIDCSAQSLWRNFFTTNQSPVVDVVAGSNATVVATTPNASTRRFTVSSTLDASITNSFATTNYVNTATNGLAGTNYVNTATNGLAGTNYVNTATNGLAGTNFVNNATNGLGSFAFQSISNVPWNGAFLVNSNNLNLWSVDGSALTNVPFAIFTNYTTNPNDFTNVAGLGFGSGVYGMTSYWVYATVPGVGKVIVRHNGIDTNTVITTNGGAFTGTIVDNSSNTNAPVNNQLVTAQWVRSLFEGFGVYYYATTNINNTFTNADIATAVSTIYEFSTNIPAQGQRTHVAITNGGYFGFVVTTNTFLQLNSGITVSSYFDAKNGSGTTGPQVKPEIYISYDRTNWFGDWDSQPQNIPEGSTNLYSWVIANPTYTSTNSTGFYVQRRYKMVTQTTPTASDITFYLGTNYPSHIALAGATSGGGNAYLAANQTFTGTNTFSKPIFGQVYATNVLGASYYPFDLNVNATGTNIYISPTNGPLKVYTFTNTAYATVLRGILITLRRFGWNCVGQTR